jgi:hypothetical protein
MRRSTTSLLTSCTMLVAIAGAGLVHQAAKAGEDTLRDLFSVPEPQSSLASTLASLFNWGNHQSPNVAIEAVGSPFVRIGHAVELDLQSDQDGFAHLYVLSASGKVQLWTENLPIQGR